MKKGLDKLLKTCYTKSIMELDMVLNKYHVVACLLDKRGRVIARKNNDQTKTHTKAKEYDYEYPFLHAELNVCVNYGIHNCRGLDLIVFRITPKEKKLTMAKPCPKCHAFLRKIGIRDVFYTNWHGEIERLEQ